MPYKVAIFCTISDPNYWQYAFKESLDCYSDIADEVVVVDGSLIEFELVRSLCSEKPNVKYIRYPWDYNFRWEEIAKHIQMGFENVSDDIDIAIKMDIDYLIHDESVPELKEFLQDIIEEDFTLGSMKKFTLLNDTDGFVKALINNVVNMKYRSSIAFGRDIKSKTDWCFPIVKSRKDNYGLWEGYTVHKKKIDHTLIPIYNYDYFFKTKQKASESFYRFSRAAIDGGFNEGTWGGTLDRSRDHMFERYKGFGEKKLMYVKSHPKWIVDRVKNLKETERGYDNWELNEGGEN